MCALSKKPLKMTYYMLSGMVAMLPVRLISAIVSANNLRFQPFGL